MRQTAESLNELIEDVRVNGFQSPVTLAIDPVLNVLNVDPRQISRSFFGAHQQLFKSL